MSNLKILRLIAACGIASSIVLSANAQTRSTLDQAPAKTDSEIEQGLRRYLGQTRFISAQRQYRQRAALESGAAPAAMADSKGLGGAGERRDVVDSDIFNAGPEGSKILLLLNGYRGLMVLDFSKGAENPVLMGRSPATGNHPSNMYVDWKTRRAIVIENWQRENYGAGARILVYDLSDLANPKVIQNQEVGGSVSDSRLVGDVLYLVGAQQSEYYSYGSQDRQQSYIKSFRVSGKGIEPVATEILKNHIDYRENMGIQEVRTADGAYKYYVTAITKTQGQWWWRGRSEVEIFDISSPAGEIRPTLIASVTGDIAKRSWVNIRNDTLTVVSNYRPDANNWQSPMRVAVETYRLPGAAQAGDAVISSDELKFRELAIPRGLGANATPEDKERALSEGEFKLRNVFVREEVKDQNNPRQKRTFLRKVVSDFKTLDFGDTRGQSASVQDVRYVADDSGNVRAHVFWVPANMVDPLDIVDITNVNARPVHQSQLEFSGWIERSIPINFNGRRFIVALGYIVPAVDNPENKRFAQAKIFEIKRARGATNWTAVEVDTLNLLRVQWSDVGGHDKLLGVQYDAATGKGSVLFQGSSWSRDGYSSGGQAVNFDLSLAADESAKLLTEGAFIKGEEGWLRRVFMHPNLQAMMTFSERELGVFKSQPGDKVVEAATRMELARNIVAYHEVPAQRIGIQVVQRGDYYSRNAKAVTEIRIVPIDKADAEKPGVLATAAIVGNYKDHWIDAETGEILVLTTKDDYDYGNDETTYTHKFRVERLRFEGGKLVAQSVDHESKRVEKNDPESWRRRQEEHALTSNCRGLVRIAKNRWAFTDGSSQVWQVEATASGLTKTQVKLTGELAKGRLELTVMDGQLFAIGRRTVGKAENFDYYESYIGPVNMTDAANWTIPANSMVNIPGLAEGFVIRDGEVVGIVSKENRVVDMAAGSTEPVIHLTWLNDNGQVAELRSMMNSDESLQLVRTSGNQWMFIEKGGEGSGDDYRPMVWHPHRHYGQQQGLRLGMLDVDMKSPALHRTVRQLDGALEGYSAQILKVAQGSQPHLRLVAVTAGSNIQVLEVNMNTKEVKALTIKPLNTFVSPVQEPKPDDRRPVEARPATVWSIPGYAWMGYGMRGGGSNNSVTVTPTKILIASGDYGVCEAEISAPKEIAPKQ